MARAISAASPPRFIGTAALTRSTRPGSPPRGVELRVDDTRPDRVDADAFFGHFVREADGHRVHRALGGRVVDVFARPARPGRHGGDVHDPPAGAAVARGHAAHRGAAAQEHAQGVDLQRTFDTLGGHLVEPHLEVERAGVVDQHREGSELGVDGGEHSLHVVLGRDVGPNRRRTGAVGPYLLGNRLGGAGVLPIADRHVVSAFGREHRARCADPPARAGNEHHFAHVRSCLHGARPLRRGRRRLSVLGRGGVQSLASNSACGGGLRVPVYGMDRAGRGAHYRYRAERSRHTGPMEGRFTWRRR